VCFGCGSSELRYLATDVRPVFARERRILERLWVERGEQDTAALANHLTQVTPARAEKVPQGSHSTLQRSQMAVIVQELETCHRPMEKTFG